MASTRIVGLILVAAPFCPLRPVAGLRFFNPLAPLLEGVFSAPPANPTGGPSRPSFSGVLGGQLRPSSTFGPPRQLAHNSYLPRLTASLVAPSDRLILSFVLEYLAEQERLGNLRNVSMHISGGYVRDLLLGRASDDLDLALCLRSCAEAVTIDTVVAGMPAFARSRPDLAVEAVEIVTGLSDAARSKSVDAAAVRMLIAHEWRLVDVMPTIGEEVYDESDRIPHRDARGTTLEDTLRRDLTIGAMLLEVTRPEARAPPAELQHKLAVELERRLAAAERADDLDVLEQEGREASYVDALLEDVGIGGSRSASRSTGGSGRADEGGDTDDGDVIVGRPGGSWAGGGFSVDDGASGSPDGGTYTPGSVPAFDECVRAASLASSLQFRLLDYHGGVADLGACLLRPPVPQGLTTAEMAAAVLRTPDEAAQFREAVDGVSAEGRDDEWERQSLWWIKSLRDDPLRLVRALRYSASLGFDVHGSFWVALPFAVEALRVKVSGSRKVTELRKIAAAGRPALLDFFERAFTPIARYSQAEVAFGDALFGGPSADGEEVEQISFTLGFDPSRMRSAARHLPDDGDAPLSDEAAVGGVLACALISCDLRPCDTEATLDGGGAALGAPCFVFANGDGGGEGVVDGGEASSFRLMADSERDEEAAAAAEISLSEAIRVCDGLRAPSAMRQAAVEPLRLVQALVTRQLDPPPPLGMHGLFAASAALWSADGAYKTYAPVDFADAADGNEFASLVHCWDLLKLDPNQTGRRLEVGADFVIGLARTRCSAATAARLDAQMRVLRTRGPTVQGRALAGLPEVPPHLRSHVIASVHALCRLRGEAPALETPEALRSYLEDECGGLLSKLASEWWEGGQPGGRLRPAYSKAAMNAWLRGDDA